MAYLNVALRRTLERTIREARVTAEAGAADALRRLGVAEPRRPAHLTEAQGQLRNRLRAHARALGDALSDGTQAIGRLTEQAAYVQWHRLLFARFLLERRLLRHPQDGGNLTLLDCREEASALGLPDEWAAAAHYTALLLPGVFPPDDPVEAVSLAPEHARALRRHLLSLDADLFAAEDTLGWTYQFWRAAEKKAVNEAQVKIGAAELPAVTQLFTEPYMVKFLLHNTLGAWWAGKVLAARPDLARAAPDENALRQACALPGVAWDYLRFVRPLLNPPPQAGEGGVGAPSGAARENADRVENNGPWRPAAGTFPGWPERPAEITYLDPCCGSGHFLVEAFGILAVLRQAEEGLSPEEAARAVLRDNLHGLEIDGRCVQIAAFNVALAAWRLAGGPVKLPAPHIAWVGAPPPLPKAEFVALANGDAELQRGLAALHDLFRKAPLLGSLIELGGGDLVDPTRIAGIEQSISALVEKMREAEPERAEGAIAARGMADAASLLNRRYTLVSTNVPFLGRGEQSTELSSIIGKRFHLSRRCLSTTMLERITSLINECGSFATVTKQEWCFLVTYTDFRQWLLRNFCLDFLVFLGEEAWGNL